MTQNLSQRFWRNYRENRINTGSAYIIAKGIKLPMHEEMDKMDKYHLSYDIDPWIRNVILDLNQHGLKTMGSCAGHTNKSDGFVTFSGNPSPQKTRLAISILRKHGLQNIRRVKDEPEYWWGVTFNPVGVVGKSQIREQYKKLKRVDTKVARRQK